MKLKCQKGEQGSVFLMKPFFSSLELFGSMCYYSLPVCPTRLFVHTRPRPGACRFCVFDANLLNDRYNGELTLWIRWTKGIMDFPDWESISLINRTSKTPTDLTNSLVTIHGIHRRRYPRGVSFPDLCCLAHFKRGEILLRSRNKSLVPTTCRHA